MFVRVSTALLAVVIAVVGWSGRADVQERALVFVDPPSQQVAPAGGDFDVRIMVDDVTPVNGLGGYSLAVAYDPAVVHGRAITDAEFVSSTGNAVLCPSSGIDNDAGRLAHFCLTLPVLPEPGPTATEPTLLATVTFEPVGEGTTELNIQETSLTDTQGNLLGATKQNATVTVSVAPQEDGAGTAAPSAGQADLPAAGNGQDGGSNVALYAGLAAGGAAAVVLLAGGWLFLARRRGGGQAIDK